MVCPSRACSRSGTFPCGFKTFYDADGTSIRVCTSLLTELEGRFQAELDPAPRIGRVRRGAGSIKLLDAARTVLREAPAFVARSFCVSHGPRIYPVLFEILDDPEADETLVLRTLSIISALRTDRSDFIQPVLRTLLRKETSIRVATLRLIGSIGSARHTPPVAALLFETPRSVAYEAAHTLAKIGSRSDLISLELAINVERHPFYRKMVFRRIPFLTAHHRLEQRLLAERLR